MHSQCSPTFTHRCGGHTGTRLRAVPACRTAACLRVVTAGIFLCLLVTAPAGLVAQERDSAAIVQIDTLAAGRPPVARDTSTAPFVMAKSPWGAVLRSALLPGLGQVYNETWWKVPLVVGVSAFLIRGIIVEHSSYVEWADRYAVSITGSQPAGDLRLKQFREYYRNRRDTYAWWFVVSYLVQLADAFVGAHLYDFDVSDTAVASLRLSPAGLGVRISW